MEAALRWLADQTPGSAEMLRLMYGKSWLVLIAPGFMISATRLCLPTLGEGGRDPPVAGPAAKTGHVAGRPPGRAPQGLIAAPRLHPDADTESAVMVAPASPARLAWRRADSAGARTVVLDSACFERHD